VGESDTREAPVKRLDVPLRIPAMWQNGLTAVPGSQACTPYPYSFAFSLNWQAEPR
jgi:hypothetical protein